jgi:hypothetical protein
MQIKIIRLPLESRKNENENEASVFLFIFINTLKDLLALTIYIFLA